MKYALAAALIALTACSSSNPPAPPEPPPATAQVPAFANRIWQVSAGSDIPAGALYVFLEDNTLLITSATGKPAIGRWLMSGPDMIMIEEGMQYRTRILESSAERLRLEQTNPGGVLKLVFTPAVTRTLRQ